MQTILLANTLEELQLLIDRIVIVCSDFMLRLNTAKTNYVVVIKQIE